jgi:hypothetical protein
VNLVDLLWGPPLLLAIATVLGTSGRRRWSDIRPAIRRNFVALLIGLTAVAAGIHVVVRAFV